MYGREPGEEWSFPARISLQQNYCYRLKGVFIFIYGFILVCHKYIIGWKITEFTILLQTKDFQTCILVIKWQIREMLIAFGVSRALSDFSCSLLSRMKLMTGKETELLRELAAKWYFFTLRSLHIVCMIFCEGKW